MLLSVVSLVTILVGACVVLESLGDGVDLLLLLLLLSSSTSQLKSSSSLALASVTGINHCSVHQRTNGHTFKNNSPALLLLFNFMQLIIIPAPEISVGNLDRV